MMLGNDIDIDVLPLRLLPDEPIEPGNVMIVFRGASNPEAKMAVLKRVESDFDLDEHGRIAYGWLPLHLLKDPMALVEDYLKRKAAGDCSVSENHSEVTD